MAIQIDKNTGIGVADRIDAQSPAVREEAVCRGGESTVCCKPCLKVAGIAVCIVVGIRAGACEIASRSAICARSKVGAEPALRRGDGAGCICRRQQRQQYNHSVLCAI